MFSQVVALRGMEVLGRKKYGSFPLRGKMLNALKATRQQTLENQEQKYLMEILGLRIGTPVRRLQDLRYTSLMILTDADPDGKHIGGLILCFIAKYWPELLSMGFIKLMLTPVAKAGSQCFYDLESYRDWQASVTPAVLKRTNVRFYKGLGTSTAEEAKGYYRDLSKNLKRLTYDAESMGSIEKMFQDGREAVEKRKEWILGHIPSRIDYSRTSFSITEYIEEHVIEYCIDDISRSIVGLDGLKTTQRKILWALMMRPHPEKQLKVCQLAGFVAERACYHHGEASLNSTIIGMAQDFVGKQQVPLLQAHSNFGTRMMGGSDASSPRYIDTSLSKMAQLIFPKEDLPFLPQQIEDGTPIEPEYMLGVVPMILVNPSTGIAVGWNSNWMPFQIEHVVGNILRHLDGEPMDLMDIHFRGFKGFASFEDDVKWVLRGCFEWLSESQVRVTELPPGKWPGQEKEKLVAAGVVVEDRSPSPEEINMTITFGSPESAKKWVESMTVSVSTKYMNVLWEGKIRRYAPRTETDFIRDFAVLRLDLFEKRRLAECSKLRDTISKQTALIQFISAVVQGDIVLSALQDADEAKVICADKAPLSEPFIEDFLGLPLRTLTKRRVTELLQQKSNHEQRLLAAETISPSDMWKHALQPLVSHIPISYSCPWAVSGFFS
jgi:DNA topoisomerase-2